MTNGLWLVWQAWQWLIQSKAITLTLYYLFSQKYFTFWSLSLLSKFFLNLNQKLVVLLTLRTGSFSMSASNWQMRILMSCLRGNSHIYTRLWVFIFTTSIIHVDNYSTLYMCLGLEQVPFEIWNFILFYF